MRIDKSMKLFLKGLSGRLSAKTNEKYKDVLWLFKDYLANYGELSHEEHKDKGIVLTAVTEELTDSQVENFLEWLLIRKVVGPAWLNTPAPESEEHIQWLDKEGLLAEGARMRRLKAKGDQRPAQGRESREFALRIMPEE
jgi:hypothetical protein